MSARTVPSPTRRGRCLCLLVALSVAAMVAAALSCSRPAAERPARFSIVDTLPNGLPRVLQPKLAAWVELWHYAIPALGLDSLERLNVSRFTSDYGPLGKPDKVSETRVRAEIAVWSPDSTKLLDLDTYLDFGRDENGTLLLEREPDSEPVLSDFQSDTLWRVAFCGTPCAYDGAYWVDSERFALTGTTQTGLRMDGPWQGFLDIYDLRARSVSRWGTRPVNDLQFGRYVSAMDSSLTARIERALHAGSPGPSTKVPGRPAGTGN